MIDSFALPQLISLSLWFINSIGKQLMFIVAEIFSLAIAKS
ncbi:hypothetical protein [cyanobacterium endosymbiont of Epithemia turgida]|nr:hypothetical protein [cyanobacterium endosymbiont of Epithemia turgida]